MPTHMTNRQVESELATLLMHAHRTGTASAVPATLTPADRDAAYVIQHEMIARRKQEIGGFKVGAKTPDGPIQGSLLPADCIMPDPTFVSRDRYPSAGFELEITFTFSRTFSPRAEIYSDAEVFESLSLMGTAIEIVSSRVAGWPQVDPLIQLADMQNHGALIVGEMIDYDPAFPFLAIAADLRIDTRIIFSGTGRNPAGDPRCMLPWVVNHYSARGLTLKAGDIITTGTYTGIDFPETGGTLSGQIGSLPPIRLMLL